MESSPGGIDLNRAHTDSWSDDEPSKDHGSTEGVGVPQEDGDERGIVSTIEDSNIVLTDVGKEVLRITDEEEPEEGEISDDNTGPGDSVLDNDDKGIPTPHGADTPACEPSPAGSKATAVSYGSRWANRSNGDSRHGTWNLCPDTPAYSVQPDKFYQFAWAKGVQESPNDSLGDSLQDERVTKARKTGDSSCALNRSGSADRKTGWIVGDRGIDLVKCTRREDGYFFLQEGGDRLDQRRGEGWRERGERGSSERVGKGLSGKANRDYMSQSEERSSVHDRERRRSEGRRFSRDSRRREGRGEGDLEEGEIELKQAIMADKAAIERHMKGRDKAESRQGDKLHVKGSGLAVSVWLSESQRDKLLAEAANNVKSVSVKDAQKSFMGVCVQLRRALRVLRDLNKDLSKVQGKHIESQQRKMLALTRDTFSGIQATYAVRNTAVGKEQERDPNAFLRLLELARNRCENLFTSKQIQELESMMQALGYGTRPDERQKLVRKALSASHQAESGEDGDPKIGESSGNTSATTQLESESTTETSENVRALELGDEAEQPLNLMVDLNICESSFEEQSASAVDSSKGGRLSSGDWFSYGPEQGCTQEHDNAKQTESLHTSRVSSVVDLNEDQMLPEASGEEKSNFLGNSNAKSVHDRNSGSFTSNSDPIRALNYYHEKFAGKSHVTNTRLPSPTPSDEGEAVENSAVEASRGGDGKIFGEEAKTLGKDVQSEESIQALGPIRFPLLTAAHQEQKLLLKERATLSELTLFPSPEMRTVEDGSIELRPTKLILSRGVKRNRDPRRRLEGQPIDLEIPQQETVGDERMPWSQEISMIPIADLSVPNKQFLQASQEAVPLKGELLSLLTLATGGGWPSEQIQTSITPDSGLQAIALTGKSIEDSSQSKKETDLLNEESSGNKRPRTALILKGCDGAPSKAVDMSSVGQVDNLKQDLPSETLPSKLGSSMAQGASATELGVHGSVKQRMKPRDPRRALLGASMEDKSKVVLGGLAKGNSSSAISGTEAATPSSRDAVVSTSELIFSPNAAEKLVLTNSIVRNETVPSERPAEPANVLTDAQTNSIPGNEGPPLAGDVALQIAVSGGLLRDSDPSGNNCRPDDLPKISRATEEAKVNVTRPLGRFDLNISAIKQRENINHWDHLETILEGLDEKQKQAVRQERARRIEEQSRMFNARKLCLVLDLDHTLLNSAKFSEIEDEWEAKLQANELTERNKFDKEGGTRRELYRFQHMGMWTKLRPGIWNFLARASHLYELHVYTMGNKAYATEMAKLLDPTGTLFAGRVISKGDDGDIVDGDERPPKSKDLDGVLGMESAVVIIDDSARVWPHHRHNLIVVERYMYFPCSRKQFGLPGPSLLAVGHDEREQDGMLASALAVIERVHYNFFSNPRLHEVDVRDILAKEQYRVLAGCKLVFSRVFPQGEIQAHLHPLWQLAEQFGAVCSIGIDDGVTHVVAISLGTEKVNWALSTGRYVVRPSWLEASAILYRRANERDFSVTA